MSLDTAGEYFVKALIPGSTSPAPRKRKGLLCQQPRAGDLSDVISYAAELIPQRGQRQAMRLHSVPELRPEFR